MPKPIFIRNSELAEFGHYIDCLLIGYCLPIAWIPSADFADSTGWKSVGPGQAANGKVGTYLAKP